MDTDDTDTMDQNPETTVANFLLDPQRLAKSCHPAKDVTQSMTKELQAKPHVINNLLCGAQQACTKRITTY